MYKVPIERLHVRQRQKMPVVQKQSWTETSFVSTRVSETGGGGIHIWDLSAPGKEKKYNTRYIFDLWEKIRPVIGEWYIPLTDVKDAPSSKANLIYVQLVVQNQKTQWGEFRSEV